jgi:hypothetical protein
LSRSFCGSGSCEIDSACIIGNICAETGQGAQYIQ